MITEIPADRYSSKAFQALEWQRLWRRVWNMGPRLDELRNPGDYVTHTLGKENLVFVLDKERRFAASSMSVVTGAMCCVAVIAAT